MRLRAVILWLPRFVRGAALAGLGLMAVLLLLGILLWDADLYTLRDKYERAKLALFGEWQAEAWCPPGRVSDLCTDVADFTAALEAESDFTFFRPVPVEGSDLVVQTGLRFDRARDVVDGQPAHQWCYLSLPGTGSRQQIDLATQSADDPPAYAALSSLNADILAGSGLGVDQLDRLARTHCRFATLER